MTASIKLIVDTNLFHECHKLDAPSFPWSALGAFDEIILIVPDPVQAELDNQKKDTRPRVKRRAVEAVTWFREMLVQGLDEKVLRAAGPRVILRPDVTPTNKEHADVLDYDVADDRIVGVAAALVAASPGEDIRVLSHDTRPAMKAKALNIPFVFMPENWIREAEEDDLQKENKRLKEENKALRNIFPEIKVQAEDAEEGVVKLTRTAYREMQEDELELLRRRLVQHFPIDEVMASKASRPPKLGYRTERYEFVAPASQEVSRYRDETYPNWIDASLQVLQRMVEAWNLSTPAGPMIFNMFNKGSRPAEDLRISFSAKGSLMVCAPLPKDRVVEVEFPALTHPPTAPRGYWTVDGTQVAVVSQPTLTDPLFMGLGPSNTYRHDKEDELFYYDPDRSYAPAERLSLVCRRVMHSEDAKPFEVDLYPQTTGPELRAAVEVFVQATNLPNPFRSVTPVLIETILESPFEALCTQIEHLASSKKRPNSSF